MMIILPKITVSGTTVVAAYWKTCFFLSVHGWLIKFVDKKIINNYYYYYLFYLFVNFYFFVLSEKCDRTCSKDIWCSVWMHVRNDQ